LRYFCHILVPYAFKGRPCDGYRSGASDTLFNQMEA
jgi:hypothetical protein